MLCLDLIQVLPLAYDKEQHRCATDCLSWSMVVPADEHLGALYCLVHMLVSEWKIGLSFHDAFNESTVRRHHECYFDPMPCHRWSMSMPSHDDLGWDSFYSDPVCWSLTDNLSICSIELSWSSQYRAFEALSSWMSDRLNPTVKL